MINRRKFCTATALAAGGSVGAVSAKSLATSLALDKPSDYVRAYTKITGSLDEQEVYLQYYGEIFSVVPAEEPQPILALKGLVRMRWTPNGDGTYSHENYDHGLFCDYETGKVLTEYKNPLTGETNKPLHYKSGPAKSTVGLAEGQNNPRKNTWRVMGDQVSLTNSRTSIFTNPVSPDRWGKASTGEKVPFLTNSTYLASAAEVADSSNTSVDCGHIWNFVTAYPAWMLVGEKPGSVLWSWVGRKFSNPALIDPYIKSEILNLVPNFLTADAPWPERLDGWTQYSRERSPIEE